MSEYSEVNARLMAIERELEEKSSGWEDYEEELIRAQAEADKEEAKALLGTDRGNAEGRKADALLTTVKSGKYDRLVEAKVKREVARKRESTLDKRASILQSRLRAMTREASQSGQQPAWRSAA